MTKPKARKVGDPKLTPRSPFGLRPSQKSPAKGSPPPATTGATSTAGSLRQLAAWLKLRLTISRVLLVISAVLTVSLLMWVTALLLQSPNR
jgi:hypothetical protein